MSYDGMNKMNKIINGQHIVDKIVTAKHIIAGQDVAKAVLKATTDEVRVPKRKHLDYLILYTENPNVSIHEMAKLLLDRAHNPHWAVAYKALITIHDLMNYGNEIYFQHMASNNFSLSFDNFSDTNNATALHMSRFVRSYAKYVNSKAVSFRLLGYDFCKVKRGANDSFFRKMEVQHLLEPLGRLQCQIDQLLAFDPFPRDLSNAIINISFMNLYKDLLRLYTCYKEGIANLTDKFFHLDKKSCREAFTIYKKFVTQVEVIADFFQVAEESCVEKSDIPKKIEISSSLTEAFEQHLKSFDSVKKTTSNAFVSLPKPDEQTVHSTKRLANMLKRRSLPPGSMGINGNNLGKCALTSQEKQEIINDEQKQLEALKEKRYNREMKSASFHPNISISSKNNDSIDTPTSNSAGIQSNLTTNKTSPFSDNLSDFVFEDTMFQPSVTTSLQSSQPVPPPGFTGSGLILQPTKLHSSTLSSNLNLDFSNLSISSPNQPTRPAILPFNNLQASPAYIIPVTPLSPTNGTAFASPSFSPVHLFPSNMVSMPSQQQNPFL